MIETIMVFALGFLTAGMLSLLFLPLFWWRAVRLSTRRLELQMPLSMNEVFAERDQLRAEFAAERRKLEQQGEKIAARLALTRVELGKRMISIAELEDRLAKVEQGEAEARAQLAISEWRTNELQLERAAFDKAHYDVAGLLERRISELSDLKKKHQALGVLSDERRVTVVVLESQLVGLQMQLHSTQENLQRTSKALAEKISQFQNAERERERFHADLKAANAHREVLRDSLVAQQRLVEKLDGELRIDRRQKGKLTDDNVYLKQLLDRANEDFVALKVNLRQQEQARAQDRAALAESIESRKAGQAMLQGALEVLRRDNKALRAELSRLQSNNQLDIQGGKVAGDLDKNNLVA
jgi:phage FluMu protein gp41